MRNPTGRGVRLAGAASASLLVGVVVASALVLLMASGAADPLLARLKALLSPSGTDAAPTAPSQEPVEARADLGQRTSALDEFVPEVASPRRPELPNPSALNDEAVAAMEEGDLDRAIRLLAEAVTARPENEVFASNLGEAYVRRARLRQSPDAAAAVADFDLALHFTREGQRRAQIQVLRDKSKAIAETEAEFVVEPTLHFTFKFDGRRNEILDGVEELKVLLESTYQDYGDLFGHRPVEAGEERIEVVLYRAEGFNRVTGLGDWAGGVFDGTIRVPAEDLTDLRRVARLKDVLRHEVAHAFTQSIGGSKVPSWLNEGIAQWLESPGRRHESVQIARARLSAARTQQQKELFPLSTLSGSLVAWEDKGEITRAYDQALAFTDYLTRQYGSDLVFEMAAACKDGGPIGATELFQTRILDDLDVVLADFGETLR